MLFIYEGESYENLKSVKKRIKTLLCAAVVISRGYRHVFVCGRSSNGLHDVGRVCKDGCSIGSMDDTGITSCNRVFG
jgi:hypothetical protein